MRRMKMRRMISEEYCTCSSSSQKKNEVKVDDMTTRKRGMRKKQRMHTTVIPSWYTIHSIIDSDMSDRSSKYSCYYYYYY